MSDDCKPNPYTAIISRKRDDLAELMAWRKQAMQACREEYAR